MAAHGLPNEYGSPTIGEIAVDHALAGRLPLEALIRLRCELRHLDADLEAAIALRGLDAAAETPSAPEAASLTPQDAALRFNVPKRWLLAHAHEIPGTVALSRKTIRFDAVRLARWLERHRKAS